MIESNGNFNLLFLYRPYFYKVIHNDNDDVDENRIGRTQKSQSIFLLPYLSIVLLLLLLSLFFHQSFCCFVVFRSNRPDRIQDLSFLFLLFFVVSLLGHIFFESFVCACIGFVHFFREISTHKGIKKRMNNDNHIYGRNISILLLLLENVFDPPLILVWWFYLVRFSLMVVENFYFLLNVFFRFKIIFFIFQYPYTFLYLLFFLYTECVDADNMGWKMIYRFV